MLETVGSVLADQMSAPVEFENVAGEKSMINLSYDFSSSHVIPELFDSSLAKVLKLNEESETLFSEQILRLVTSEIPSQTHEIEAREFLENFNVYRALPQDGRGVDHYEIAEVGTRRYFALKENKFAADAIKNLKIARVLSQLEEAKFTQIFDAVKAGKREPPADASDLEKQVYAMDADVLEAFGNGLIKSEGYYAQLLSILPLAQ